MDKIYIGFHIMNQILPLKYQPTYQNDLIISQTV